jgi:L-seryl-tRNA(Ser) seleniumtransferase
MAGAAQAEAGHDSDRFGNVHAEGVAYARGDILTSVPDDFAKLRRAWEIIGERRQQQGAGSVLNFSGLERGLHLDGIEPDLLDDEIAAAVCFERLRELGLEHLGGDPTRHDIFMLNRVTAALYVAHMIMVKPGDTVVGVTPRYSHPAVTRAVRFAGGRFVDTVGLAGLADALEREPDVAVVTMTRLSVSYEALPNDELPAIVELAHRHGAKVIVDDAGGARVGPAQLGQPKTLELGVDVGATGLDKYGTVGPRLGLLGGEAGLVEAIRTRAFELGMEARPMLYPAIVKSLEGYSPERVRELVETTMLVADALERRLGGRLTRTPVTGQLLGEDTLEIATERAGLSTPPIVPYEATAALAMLLLRDHGMLTVHFAGLPPGTSALLFKFVDPVTLERLGGPDRFAEAVDQALDALAALISDPVELRRLLLG